MESNPLAKFLRSPMKRLLILLTLVTCFVVLLVPSASAQFESASILGYVRDSSGAILPNATVTLTNQETSLAQTAKTNSEGSYPFGSVAPGQYKVTAEVQGFDISETSVFKLTTN